MAKYTVVLDIGSQYVSAGYVSAGYIATIPSVVAMSGDNIVSVGVEALGQLANGCKLIYPILEGTIVDVEASKALFVDVLHKVLPSKVKIFGSVHVVCCVPSAMISSDKKTIESVLLSIGICSVSFVESALACSVALFQEFHSNRGLIVNIGSDCADFGVVYGDNIVAGCTLYYGGKALTQAIIEKVRKKYLVQLSTNQAEQFKLKCASLYSNDSANITVSGVNVQTNHVESINISAKEMYDTVVDYVKKYTKVIASLVSCVPDQISQAIKQEGVMLCGGGANLVGLDHFVHQETNLPIRIAKDARNVSINGLLAYCVANHN